MVTTLPTLPESIPAGEQRLRLDGVTWRQYDALIALFMNQFPALRMTYLKGILELMSTSAEHERLKKVIGRLIGVFAEEAGLNLNGYGSATFQREAAACGLEPDECYTFGVLKETPDLAIEVVITSGDIDKLNVYKGLGVQEVWFWENGVFSLYTLIDPVAGYEKVETSLLIPGIDLAALSTYIDEPNQTQAVNAYRRSLQKKSRE